MNIKALELATRAMHPEAADALYYRIAPNRTYGGWSDLAAAIVDRRSLTYVRLEGLRKAAADLANGRVNFNLPIVPEQIRAAAGKLEQQGCLERCAYGAPAEGFRQYDNHLILSANWAVTGRCNFKCKHCFLSAPGARFGELSTEDCKRIIREMAEIGLQAVSMTGGEALIRSDFMELVDELVKNGIHLKSISSNGALVNDRLLDQLEDRGLKPTFFMSFDGVGWHDWLRGMEGAEKMLMGKFELLAKRGFKTGSAFTMHRLNKGVLRESINRLASVGAQSAIINRMLNFGEWRQYGQDFNITHREVFETYLEYLPHFFEDGMPIDVFLNRMISLHKGSYDYQFSAVKNAPACGEECVCRAMYRTLFINGDGKVAPCISIAGIDGQQKNFADLGQMSLKQAVTDSEFSRCAYRTVEDYEAHNPECAACAYRSYCRGGCRAQALEFDENDFLAMDRHRCEFFFGRYVEQVLARLAETVPQARCTNLPADYPLKPLAE